MALHGPNGPQDPDGAGLDAGAVGMSFVYVPSAIAMLMPPTLMHFLPAHVVTLGKADPGRLHASL